MNTNSMSAQHTPRRPLYRAPPPVAIEWTVQEGMYFPKIIGRFDTEAEAERVRADHVNPNARSIHVSAWSSA